MRRCNRGVQHRVGFRSLAGVCGNPAFHDRHRRVYRCPRTAKGCGGNGADEYLRPGKRIERAIIDLLPRIFTEKSFNRAVRAILGNEYPVDSDVMTAGALQAKDLPAFRVNLVILPRQKEGPHIGRSLAIFREYQRAEQHPAAMERAG